MEDNQTRPSEQIPPVCTFVTSSTKIISYSLHKVQKLTEILPQQGKAYGKMAVKIMSAKSKFQGLKSLSNFVWLSAERLEFTKLLASALMNLSRWFRMKKAWAGKSLTSFVIFSPRTRISTGTFWTEPRCHINSCKITGSNFRKSPYVPICLPPEGLS